jgi:hypothetical protein
MRVTRGFTKIKLDTACINTCMNLNNIKTGVQLIKQIISNNKSVNAPWHKKNQVESTKQPFLVKPNKDVK